MALPPARLARKTTLAIQRGVIGQDRGAKASVIFGGRLTANTMSRWDLNLRASIDESGNVTLATLTGTMVETTVGNCPYPPLGRKSHTYSGGGSLDSNSIALDLTPASTNSPRASAVFRGQIVNGRLAGTLTLRRIDAAGNLAWTVQSLVK